MAAMAFREPNQVKWMGIRPGHNGTQVVALNTATNAEVLLYTVTAGKTLFLVSASVGWTGGGSGWGIIMIQTAASADWYYPCFTSGSSNYFASQGNFNPCVPLEVPAGYKCYVKSVGATFRVHGSIFGWEE